MGGSDIPGAVTISWSIHNLMIAFSCSANAMLMITLQVELAICFVLQVASDGLKPKDIVLGAQIDLR